MNLKDAEARLINAGLKPTPNRMLVLSKIDSTSGPISFGDLEIALDTIDKSSIFRVLASLLGHGLIHEIQDGSRQTKYEICAAHHGHSPADMHVHFHCTHCGRTFCLDDIPVPQVALPHGFIATGINHVVQGLCPTCSHI